MMRYETEIYYVICEDTGDEDAIEAMSSQDAIAIFAQNHNIDRWDDENTYLSIKANKLYA